jgi:hypothetical protein
MYNGTRVVRQLCSRQHKVSYDKERQAGLKYKIQRSKAISIKYALHRDKMSNDVKTYSKGMLDPQVLRKLSKADHTYAKYAAS